MPNLYDLERTLQTLWPTEHADDWDSPGFSLSIPGGIERVLLSVDLTGAVLAEAIEKQCQLVFSHHPLLLKPVSDVNWDTLKGSLLQQAVRAGVSIYAAHTNADVAVEGVSDSLASAFGLIDVTPLVALDKDRKLGHGRVGRLPREMSLKEFAVVVAEAIPFTARGVAVAGNPDATVSKVALCGGAGDSFLRNAMDAGADVFVTSDLRHHVTLDATTAPRQKPFALVEISHWAAESIWLQSAREKLAAAHPDVSFTISEVVTDPWTFSINRGTE